MRKTRTRLSMFLCVESLVSVQSARLWIRMTGRHGSDRQHERLFTAQDRIRRDGTGGTSTA